jgi:hypothetical protein
MLLTAQQQLLAVLLFWACFLLLAAFILRQVCSVFGVDMPSYTRGVLAVLVSGGLAWFTFDLSAYGILLAMKDVVPVPPGYTYANWLREPLALKWHVLGKVPMVRYLPIVFALCVAGVAQVALFRLQVTFRIGLVMFAVQWGVNFVAFFLLTFAFQTALAGLQMVAPPAPDQASAPRPGEAQGQKEGLESLKQQVDEQVRRWWAEVQPHLEPVKEALGPLARLLPQPVRDFLDRGGWGIVIGVLGFLALMWVLSVLRRVVKALRRPRRRRKKPKATGAVRREDLIRLGEGYTEPGPRQVTVNGIQARLRLVVLAPANRETGEVRPDAADHVLDWIKAGLSEVAASDYPGVRVWPLMYSEGAFAAAFAGAVPIPERAGLRSHWVLVSGTVSMGLHKLHVGLVLNAEEPNTLRHVIIPAEQWTTVLGIEKSAALV